ncbi:ABC transporter ATP-binding protein/permease [Nonomuraea sp. NPDC050153]|uniref:ABC transporter ATP-binding protein/permease n=1 Tax=Nonomuraea sp. NPDC050153 TaxID=3364359 RepID=UPI0037A4FD4C
MTASRDWQHEWVATLTWTAEAWVVTLAACAVAVWLLTRYTGWGRQFKQLAFPYFVPLRRRGPLPMVLLMLALTILGVRLQVLISYALNDTFTALGRLDAQDFWFSIGLFVILAALYVAGSLTSYLVAQRFTIRWRTWLTDHMITDWLKGQAYHRGQFVTEPVDNPDQRIQEDVQQFVEESHSLAIGAVDAALRLVSFTVILWGLSGPISVLGVEVPRAMIILSYVYVLVASLIAFRVGHPLIRLEFLREGLSASFRHALIRLRDHSENIAFYGGERVERATLATRFTDVISNAWTIALRRLKLQGFNDSVTQLAQVFPYVIQAPRFFAGTITLGDVTQAGDAFGQVHDSLSFFRNSYDSFAGYRAALDRLTALMDTNRDSRRLPSPTVAHHPGALVIEGLRVWRPDHEPLIEGLTLTVNPGQALLVKGASGSGKTSLLRSMANIWPHAHGTIRRPVGGRTLFLSQQPYLPMGSLRAALAYPEPSHQIEDQLAREMLHRVQLGHLEFRIDEEAHWSRILSPGEQQRLGFARVLVNQPHLVFLDEATSAVDEGLEHALYRLVRERLPRCMIVSVGHRSTLNAFHTLHLNLLGAGRWGVAAA